MPLKSDFDLDRDFLAFSATTRKGLAFQPAPQTLEAERVRFKDYDRPQPRQLTDRETVDWELAVEWAIEHFQVMQGCTTFTHEETVAFILASDCRDSSPGYPWSKKYKTKKNALEDPLVQVQLQQWWEKLGTPNALSCFFTGHLKQEMLATEKVKANKTRLFMCGPLEHIYASMRLFGQLHQKLMSDSGTWCTAGRDFHYGGWNALLRRLRWEWFVAMDQSAYDMSLNRRCFSALATFLHAFVPEEHHSKVDDLLEMALDAFVIDANGYIYQKHTGNPSGWFLTLDFNTWVLYILLAYAWLQLGGQRNRLVYETEVNANLCGDDSLLSLSTDARLVMNPDEICKVWLDAHLVKVKKFECSTDVGEVEYCGATAFELDGVYVRRPRVEKFLNSLWYVRSADPEYKLQRALSLYYEMWTVPEKKIIRQYVEYLLGRYKHLQHWRTSILTDKQLYFLHTGLETSVA